jgi:hypothetical protein
MLLRALLAAVFLGLSVFLLAGRPVLAGELGGSLTLQQAILSGVMLLVGIASELIIFFLLPGGFWGTRFLHTAAVAILFPITYLIVFAATMLAGQLNAPYGLVEYPLLVAPFVIGFLGFLLISAVAGPMPRHIDLPGPLRAYLHANETPLWRVQQTRLKHPITPHTLVATDQRLIVYRPTKLGLAFNIEDYNYVDIANVRIESGLFFSRISMKERFQGDDMAFPNIQKQAGEEFVRMVTDQTQRRQAGTPLVSGRGPVAPQAAPPQPAAPAVPAAPPADSQALQILQRRLAAGEITPEQYEQLRHVLGGP